MFKYKGCTGVKTFCPFTNSWYWAITLQDGELDIAHSLKIAMMLCDGTIRHMV